MNLSHFCRTFDNNMPSEICDELIEIFDNNSDLHEHYNIDYKPKMTMLNLTKNRHINQALHDNIVMNSYACFEQYRELVPEANFFPKRFAFEEFRIKMYNEGGEDRFDEHVDVATLESAKRFLIFFWYLNDVEEGGETEVTNIKMIIKPEKGKLLMMPPMWMFPHRGYPVTKGKKYLLSSYLHFDKNS